MVSCTRQNVKPFPQHGHVCVEIINVEAVTFDWKKPRTSDTGV